MTLDKNSLELRVRLIVHPSAGDITTSIYCGLYTVDYEVAMAYPMREACA